MMFCDTMKTFIFFSDGFRWVPALQGSRLSEWWLKRDKQPPGIRGPSARGLRVALRCELHFCPAPCSHFSRPRQSGLTNTATPAW